MQAGGGSGASTDMANKECMFCYATAREGQVEVSRNHVPSLFAISVHNSSADFGANLTFR